MKSVQGNVFHEKRKSEEVKSSTNAGFNFNHLKGLFTEYPVNESLKYLQTLELLLI